MRAQTAGSFLRCVAILAGFAGLGPSGCGKPTRVEVAQVNGVDAEGARHAIFDADTLIEDLDGDLMMDDTLAFMSIVISDQADLCARIEAGDSADEIADVVLADVFVSLNEIDTTETPFWSGATFTGNGIEDYVDVGLLVRAGGVTVADAVGNGTATLDVDEIGDDLSGAVTGALALDATDPTTPLPIAAAFRATLRRAAPCAALLP